MHILMWIKKNDKKDKWPAKLNPDKARRQEKIKYYYFHNDHRHTAEECRQLKDEIERLIRMAL